MSRHFGNSEVFLKIDVPKKQAKTLKDTSEGNIFLVKLQIFIGY